MLRFKSHIIRKKNYELENSSYKVYEGKMNEKAWKKTFLDQKFKIFNKPKEISLDIGLNSKKKVVENNKAKRIIEYTSKNTKNYFPSKLSKFYSDSPTRKQGSKSLQKNLYIKTVETLNQSENPFILSSKSLSPLVFYNEEEIFNKKLFLLNSKPSKKSVNSFVVNNFSIPRGLLTYYKDKDYSKNSSKIGLKKKTKKTDTFFPYLRNNLKEHW